MFHSFRHTFTTQAERNKLNAEIRERMIGHSYQGEAARYGASYEKQLDDEEMLQNAADEMAKVTYKGLNLSHLRIATAGVRRSAAEI